jgi:hypothetical protein
MAASNARIVVHLTSDDGETVDVEIQASEQEVADATGDDEHRKDAANRAMFERAVMKHTGRVDLAGKARMEQKS